VSGGSPWGAAQPEAEALVELVSYSFPWQYSQNSFFKALWTANFL
jgi:hypothetical protein